MVKLQVIVKNVCNKILIIYIEIIEKTNSLTTIFCEDSFVFAKFVICL